MNPFARRCLVVALLLVPSLWYLWPNQDAPNFCDLHDDCLYFVSAKSLAQDGAYRIVSLPGEPPQTKYPPLYPILLSLAWKVTPSFPANLTTALWISWLTLPAILWLLASLYPRLGFDGWRKWTLLTVIAVNPYTISFTATLLSEPMFVALLAGVLILAERASSKQSVSLALLAGLLMGAAYLTRSAGIVALVSFPLFFLWRKQTRLAAAFAVAMLPFVAGWMLWVRLHQTPTEDPAWMYYVDYTGYQLYNVSLHGLPVLLWKNVDGVLSSLGYLVLPRVFDSLFHKILAEVAGVAMIAGMVRMARRGQAVGYTLFALASALLLIVWHFPPNERFVYPIFPLAVAGLLVELEHLAVMLKAGLRHPKRDQRIAGMVMVGTLGLLLCTAVELQFYVSQVVLPEEAQHFRQERDKQAAAFQWIRREIPEAATVLAMHDPLFYLYTGRHSMQRPVPPKHWYNDDWDAVVDSFRQLAPFARRHQMEYVYYTGVEIGWGLQEEDKAKIDTAIRRNPELETAFQENGMMVYKLRSGLGGAADGFPQEGVDHAANQNNH